MEEIRFSEMSVNLYETLENGTRVVFVLEINLQKAADLIWPGPASFTVARLCVVTRPHKFAGFYREGNM
jgi:hypothetical protein